MTKRTYEAFCPIGSALDVVGERWTLLIVRELMLGPRRYSDLAEWLQGIGTNLLSTRLKELEQHGVVRKRTLPPPSSATVYELTDVGKGLIPVVISLARWGMGFMDEPRPEEIPARELVRGLSGLGAFFDPDLIRDVHETYEFRLGEDETYAVSLDDGHVHVSKGSAHEPDAIIETDKATTIDLAMGRLSSEVAEASGRVRVTADDAVKARVFRLIKLVERLRSGEVVPVVPSA
jgi:DNA-binding HxlR family transcriptional regulator